MANSFQKSSFQGNAFQDGTVGVVTGTIDATFPAIWGRVRGRVLSVPKASGYVSTYVPTPYRTGEAHAIFPAIFGDASGEVGVSGEAHGTIPAFAASARGEFVHAHGVAVLQFPVLLCEVAGGAFERIEGTANAELRIGMAAAGRYDMFSDADLEEIAALLIAA